MTSGARLPHSIAGNDRTAFLREVPETRFKADPFEPRGRIVMLPEYQARLPFLLRWGHPAQQQGRRFPSMSSVRTLWTRLLLVSCFLAFSTQQIHSLRASGVISSHRANAAPSA